MHIVASVISTKRLGYYVDIVSDGELYIGAFTVHGGFSDFIPTTGSRDLMSTLGHVERELLGPSARDAKINDLRQAIDIMAEELDEGGSEEHAYFNRPAMLQRLVDTQTELDALLREQGEI